MKLTRQQKKVYDYIMENRGCTTSDIQRDTKIECPSARISEMRKLGVLIISIGKQRHEGSHPSELYAIIPNIRDTTKVVVEMVGGQLIARRVHVTV